MKDCPPEGLGGIARTLRSDEVAQLYQAGKKGIVLPSLIER